MKQVFIIHGWGGNPQGNWFPWLQTELEKRGVQVVVPAMPNPSHPQMDEWLGFLDKVVGKVDENTFFVGHSLGCITILRYLERLKDGRIGGTVLVAGFSESIGIPELDSFFETPVDYETVKERCDTFIAINSDNDSFVPLDKAQILKDKLNAHLTIIHQGGHLNKDAGYVEFPLVVEEIVKMI